MVTGLCQRGVESSRGAAGRGTTIANSGGMNRINRPTSFLFIAACALGLVTSEAAPALAEGSTNGPGNLDPDNLSTINGHPIKVGEHNEYYNQNPTFSVALNPFGLLMGAYGVSGTVAVSKSIGLRGEVLVLQDFADVGNDGYSLQFGAPIFFKQMYQGFFVEPGVTVRDYSSGSDPTSGPHLMAGWQWRWDSGFTAAWAFGVVRDLNNDGNVQPTGLFHTGYTF